jgi:hypothetical protein
LLVIASRQDRVFHHAPVADHRQDRIERDFDPDRVAKLEAATGRDLPIGGAQLASPSNRGWAGGRIPAVRRADRRGGGIRSLPDQVRLNLALAEEHTFGSGVIYLCYRPARESGGIRRTSPPTSA